MSAEELYSERGAAGRQRDDAYATRSLPVREIADHSADLPLMGTPSVGSRVARRPPRGGAGVIAYIVLSVLVIALLCAGGGLYYLDRSYENKIYPNVTVQGLNVGELTQQQAETALRARYGTFLQNPATLTYGKQTWQPSTADVGMEFDFQGAIERAYRAGRGNGLIENLQEVYAIWENGLDLPVHVTFDQNKLRQYVAGVSTTLEKPPIDAHLYLNGTTVTTQPGSIGRQVLVDQTVAELAAGLAVFKPQTVALKTRELQPRLSDAAVDSGRQEIEAILQAPLTINVEDKTYVWQPDEIALMLDVARVPQDSASDKIAAVLNHYQVQKRVLKMADETGTGSVNPRVAWNNGNLKIIKPGKPGLRLNEDEAITTISAAIGGSQRDLTLPVREVDPQVTAANLNTLGITDLISVGRSDFSGSAAYRINNIGVGMNILNGILIAPGEEFSFNNNIGAIDQSQGFVEGYAIIQNRTQLEWGGGICQDSTTLFRAVFWAGLPFTERWGHSFYISWYDKYALGDQGGGPGMDATIFTGGPDLKFINNTGNWLLMQSTSDARTHTASVAFYGTKIDRHVDLVQKIRNRVPAPSAPKYVADSAQPRGTHHQTDTARGGMTIDIFRTITENGVQQKTERLTTTFRAWPNIYVYNPADLGPDGRPLPAPEIVDPTLLPPADQTTPPADQTTPPPADQQTAPPADQSPPPAEQPTPAPTNG